MSNSMSVFKSKRNLKPLFKPKTQANFFSFNCHPARDKVPDALSRLDDVLDDLHLILHGGKVGGLHGRDVDVLPPEGDLLLDGRAVVPAPALNLADELVEALEGVVAVAQDSGEFLRSVVIERFVIQVVSW